MTSPQDPDDGWADLARELGLDRPEPASAPAWSSEPAAPAHDEMAAPANEFDGEEESADEADVVPLTAEGSEAGEDESPKKKRRRRRRRKKRPAGEPGAAETETESEGDSEAEADGDGDAESASGSDDDGEAGYEDDGDSEGEAEDEPAKPSELDRGWANWDVPSWSEIVGGLYRPGR